MAECLRAAGFEPSQYHQRVHRYLFEPLVDAITDDAKQLPGWQRSRPEALADGSLPAGEGSPSFA